MMNNVVLLVKKMYMDACVVAIEVRGVIKLAKDVVLEKLKGLWRNG
jgi:hypothetical protein